MYESRKEAAAGCRMEAAAAKRFSAAAIKFAQRCECRKAWNMADTARIAATCAMQAHEALWELSGGKLTEKEWQAFEAAEIAQIEAQKAVRAAAAAVEQINQRVQ